MLLPIYSNSNHLYSVTKFCCRLCLIGWGLVAACEHRQPIATTKTGGTATSSPPLLPAKAASPLPGSEQAGTQALLALYRNYPLPLRLSTKKLLSDSLNVDTLNTGVAIPGRLLKLFGERVRHVKGAADVFAIAQVTLDNGAIGLATRILNSDENGPNPYSVQLFVFDPQRHRIVASCHIAEYITDSNAAFIREALLRQQPNKSLYIDITQRTTGIVDDQGTEVTGATRVNRKDSLVVYRLQNNRFQVVRRIEVNEVAGFLGTLDEEE